MNSSNILQDNLIEELRKHFHIDSSAVFLLISNLITIFIAVYEKWNLSELMWIYWGQSVIIGFFNRKRILDLKKFSTTGFQLNNKPTKPTKKTQKTAANFFAMHYGIFHLVYLIFIFDSVDHLNKDSLIYILVCISVFLSNHLYSYIHNRERDMKRVPNIGTVMIFPYLRIVPMHIAIIFGGLFAKGSVIALVLFLLLKTFADLVMHMIEHAQARQKSNTFLERN